MSFDWSKLKSTIGTIVPTIATVIGSPVAGIAAKGLCDIFGLNADKLNPDDIISSFQNATPEQLLKAKELEANTITKLKELDISLEQIEQMDRNSARVMAAELAKATGKIDWTPRVLALGTLAFLMCLAAVIVFFQQEAQDVAIIKEIMTILSTLLTFVFGFYFGSSSSSRAKDETIARSYNK